MPSGGHGHKNWMCCCKDDKEGGFCDGEGRRKVRGLNAEAWHFRFLPIIHLNISNLTTFFSSFQNYSTALWSILLREYLSKSQRCRMAASLYPEYPPHLTSEQSEYLLSNVKDWSILNGLAVRPSLSFIPEQVDPSRSLAVTAPVTLFPSLFPQRCFEEARAIQTAYNELYAIVARDEDWLRQVVEEYASIVVSLDFALHMKA